MESIVFIVLLGLLIPQGAAMTCFNCGWSKPVIPNSTNSTDSTDITSDSAATVDSGCYYASANNPAFLASQSQSIPVFTSCGIVIYYTKAPPDSTGRVQMHLYGNRFGTTLDDAKSKVENSKMMYDYVFQPDLTENGCSLGHAVDNISFEVICLCSKDLCNNDNPEQLFENITTSGGFMGISVINNPSTNMYTSSAVPHQDPLTEAGSGGQPIITLTPLTPAPAPQSSLNPQIPEAVTEAVTASSRQTTTTRKDMSVVTSTFDVATNDPVFDLLRILNAASTASDSKPRFHGIYLLLFLTITSCILA